MWGVNEEANAISMFCVCIKSVLTRIIIYLMNAKFNIFEWTVWNFNSSKEDLFITYNKYKYVKITS